MCTTVPCAILLNETNILCFDSKDTFLLWPFYDHSWSFFCQLHKCLSQNLGADGHFEVLNKSKY